MALRDEMEEERRRYEVRRDMIIACALLVAASLLLGLAVIAA